MFSSINRHILIPACVIAWLTLISAGEIPVLQAFPPAENIDFSEKYKQLLLQAKVAPSPGTLKEVAFEAINASQAAIQAGDYTAAVKIATLAVKIGRSAGNNHASSLATSLKQRSAILAREYRDVEKYHQILQKDPDDAHAAFLYGQFVALKLNNWKEGLSWLARGDDAGYRTLAKQELANSNNAGALLAVADGWYQLADQEKGITRQELEQHAYDLLGRVWTDSPATDRDLLNDKLSAMPLRYLNHMPEEDVVPGPKPFGKNGESGYLDGLFTVNLIEYANGLSLHPPANGFARVRYQLDGQYKTFVTGVGLLDHPTEVRSKVIFYVIGDDRVLWKSPPIQGRGDVVFCKVSVRNINRLEIRTECPGGAYGANAVWLDPHVLK